MKKISMIICVISGMAFAADNSDLGRALDIPDQFATLTKEQIRKMKDLPILKRMLNTDPIDKAKLRKHTIIIYHCARAQDDSELQWMGKFANALLASEKMEKENATLKQLLREEQTEKLQIKDELKALQDVAPLNKRCEHQAISRSTLLHRIMSGAVQNRALSLTVFVMGTWIFAREIVLPIMKSWRTS